MKKYLLYQTAIGSCEHNRMVDLVISMVIINDANNLLSNCNVQKLKHESHDSAIFRCFNPIFFLELNSKLLCFST